MNLKLIVSILVIVLVVIIAGWLLYTNYVPGGEQVLQDSTGPDNTANIQIDLSQIPDDSSVNADMQSLDANLQGF